MEFKQWLLKYLGINGAIILLFIMMILFLRADIVDTADQISKKKIDLTSRSQALNSLVTLRSDSQKAGDLYVKLQNSLPLRDQLIGFSKSLESMAKNNKLGFGFSFGSETASTETTPGINNFTLTSSGAYANFIRFLKAIEDSKYFVSFDSFDLSSKGKEFEMVLQGKVFSQ